MQKYPYPREAIAYWSEKLRNALNYLSQGATHVMFTTAYMTSKGLKLLSPRGRSVRFSGIIRSYGDVLRGNIRGSRSGRFRYLPGLHSKLILFDGSSRFAVVWSGNITRRSMEEELNHFVVVTEPRLIDKLFSDYSKMWQAAADSSEDSPVVMLPGQFDQLRMTQSRVLQEAERYLYHGRPLWDVLSRMNRTIPFYQILFCLLVARRLVIHTFIFEPNTLRKLLLPVAERGVEIDLYTQSPRAEPIVKRMNERIRKVGGREIEVHVFRGLHTKTIVVGTRRGDTFAYVGSATLSRSALYSEINHGVFVTDKKLIRDLLYVE